MTAAAADHDRTRVDWITVTHSDRTPLVTCLCGPVEPMKSGLRGYRSAVRDGFGTIYAFDGPEPRPHMLIMSSKALDAYASQGSVRELIVRLAAAGVHCTRIDLARDTSGPRMPYWLRRLIEADRYVSTWMKFGYYVAKGDTALTVQCGSRSSSSMLRCYDKKAELEGAGEVCPFDRFSRWEIQVNKPLANKAFRQVARLAVVLDAETGEECWPLRRLHSAWLERRLRLTVDPVDRDGKNQTHATTLPEWEAFLAGAADDVLAPELDDRGPAVLAAALARWLVRCIAPTLAFLFDLGGDDLITAVIRRGRGRRSAKHAMLLEHKGEALPAVLAEIAGE